MKKRSLGKPYTAQHKSTKGNEVRLHLVSEVPTIYKKSRLQQNLDRVRSSGIQPLDTEIIYKYTLNKKLAGTHIWNISLAENKTKTAMKPKSNQNMLYLDNDEMYEQILEDYNDKIWSEAALNKSNNISSPHTLLNPSYYDDK